MLTLQDSACRKFDVIMSGPMPGGKEQQLGGSHEQEEDVDTGRRPERQTASRHHQFVTSMSRCYSAVRLEVVQSAKNFLSDCHSG